MNSSKLGPQIKCDKKSLIFCPFCVKMLWEKSLKCVARTKLLDTAVLIVIWVWLCDNYCVKSWSFGQRSSEVRVAAQLWELLLGLGRLFFVLLKPSLFETGDKMSVTFSHGCQFPQMDTFFNCIPSNCEACERSFTNPLLPF